ncbi:hypothetical protein LCGC14_2966150 [marine sediment metagenome]|uniref:DUF5131 family protein n=1 Tax=marine sediment metagenome TaxID=412755 RepID=A0A0F8XY65_9ZZZZ
MSLTLPIPLQERVDKGLWWDRAWSLVSGCTPVSEACDHCWSARETHMRAKNPNAKVAGRNRGLTTSAGKFKGAVRVNEDLLDLPLRTRKRTVWSVWTDLFHEKVPDEFVALTWQMMADCPQHIFIVCTKRPERMRRWLAKWWNPDRTRQISRGGANYTVPAPGHTISIRLPQQVARHCPIPSREAVIGRHTLVAGI